MSDTEAPTVNEAFLREVLAFIELHPERWDQSQWAAQSACGTTHCLAGWAYVLGTGDWDVDVHRADLAEVIPVMAMELLGLTKDQAMDLFYFTDVRRVLIGYTPVTFVEFCERVEQVTGVRFKSQTQLCDQPS